ncbi:hypothetical protein CRG98_002672 [Punica granatum]|uniref:Extensin-like n=1 Tax=Punica granatum TaxID=22663 RepID=A0A2I0L870_PUNGR|nr:hypothetical protein CRG98_002672 [Punica granatum]
MLTTGDAPPVSHTLPIKNGREKLTRCLQREYTIDAGPFSIAHDERATIAYPCKRATSTSRSSLDPSSIANLNEHATTAGIRAATAGIRTVTADVCATVGDSSTTFAHDPTRMATLAGNVNTLQGTIDLMAANMAEMMALHRGPTVDPAPWVPPAHASEGDIATTPALIIIPASAAHPTHVPAIHSVDFCQSQSTIPATVSLPPMTIPVPDSVMFAPPPVYVSAPTTIYTVPPLMGFPASSAPALAHTAEHFPY